MLRKQSTEIIKDLVMNADPEELNYILRKISSSDLPSEERPQDSFLTTQRVRQRSLWDLANIDESEYKKSEKRTGRLGALAGGLLGASIGATAGGLLGGALDRESDIEGAGKGLGALTGLISGGLSGSYIGRRLISSPVKSANRLDLIARLEREKAKRIRVRV